MILSVDQDDEERRPFQNPFAGIEDFDLPGKVIAEAGEENPGFQNPFEGIEDLPETFLCENAIIVETGNEDITAVSNDDVNEPHAEPFDPLNARVVSESLTLPTFTVTSHPPFGGSTLPGVGRASPCAPADSQAANAVYGQGNGLGTTSVFASSTAIPSIPASASGRFASFASQPGLAANASTVGSLFDTETTSNVFCIESLRTASAKTSAPASAPAPAPAPVYVVEKLLAQRNSPEGVEYLVVWEDYPSEEDWTWEPERMLGEHAPDIVEEWNRRADEQIVDEVEKIMSKRKVKGIAHYLVKWEGYDLVKDRTWEPCDRLKVDIPWIVEAYEEKKRKK
ncbi:hypothetical protein B7494_g1386 [Chlorociboria aeruginascens]|nr:hypothetical protein B7494_g1386 [Chlorociboria aeruginascens]